MRNGKERKTSSLDCDVGFGLKMQLPPTESYTSDGGGGPIFCYTSNQYVGDTYQTASATSFQNTAFGASGESMAMSGKSLFTESQWQELERQNMIHKYILASIAVPPQLLLPTSPALSSLSQCNTSGLDLRFPSSGSDPEPWRCKRTDGKKWRCSRDVAPDQKYCERHAHKSKPRSRKHVEVPSHTTNFSRQSLTLPANQRSSSQLPTMTSYDQTRCIEWFIRGGSGSGSGSTTTTTIPISTFSKRQQRQQQVMMEIPSLSPSRFDFSKHNINHNKNLSLYNQPQYYDDNKQGFYIPDTSNLNESENHHSCRNSIPSPKIDPPHRTQTTRHFFIDACDKDVGFDDEGISISKGLAASLSKKFSPSSLSLSMMSGCNNNSGIGQEVAENENINSAAVSWMNTISPPGGPLGEALCLGNASTIRGSSNPASQHGYSNNSNTNSSSYSKSSCEDGSHALNFIG